MLKKLLYSSHARKVFERLRRTYGIGPWIVRYGNYLSSDFLKNTSEKLNEISPSMCSAKWLQATIHLGIGQTHSCHHPVRHFIDVSQLEENPSALHNTAEKIKARQQMSRGEFPKECDYCWRIEKEGGYSDRIYKSGEIWAKTELKELVKEKKITQINPTYLELSFNSDCNLRCAYCDPNISSSIKKEIQKFGPYPTKEKFQNLSEVQTSDNVVSLSPKPLDLYFWEWWKELKHDLLTLRITGGEPLLTRELDALLEKFKQDQLLKLDFAVNSNLMVGSNLVINFITKCKELSDQKKIKSFHLFTSIDTWGKHAEFLRWGLKIDTFAKNVESCLQIFPDLQITFLVTYQALSPFNFKQLLEYILDLRRRYPGAEIKIGISLLTYPSFLSLNLLDQRFFHYLEENLNFMKERRLTKHYSIGFSDFEIQRFERIVTTFRSENLTNESSISDFKLFIAEYEKRKGIQFGDYFGEFPDLVSLLD